MKVRSYLFRLTITGFAFVLGLSTQRSLQKVDRITWHWITAAATAVKNSMPLPSAYEKLFGDAKPRSAASYDLTGEYYLSEMVTPSEFKDFARIEFTTCNYTRGAPVLPAGAVYADRKYKFTNIAMDGESLTFQTEEKAGVSYQFKGRVVQNVEHEGDMSAAGDLVGRLEMLKNGSTRATLDTTLFLFCN